MRISSALALLMLAACHPGTQSAEKPAVPGQARHDPWSGIGQETLHFTGTEPFWGGEVKGGTLTWRTPEAQQGESIVVQRFAGRNGLGFSGTLEAMPFELAVSEAPCSDGMSDRTYPLAVTVLQGGKTLRGCGWTDTRSFTAAKQP